MCGFIFRNSEVLLRVFSLRMSTEVSAISYTSLTLVTVGTILNLMTFIILCRSKFRRTRTNSILHYMRTIAIFDILMLYGWNLDHYLVGVHGFALQTTSIGLCRILSFYNYFTSQSSAWLRIFVSLDRFLSLTDYQNRWFHRSKNTVILIICILIFFTLFNSLFFFYGCSYDVDGNVQAESWAFQIYPLWDYVNLGVYNFLPFILMMLFNSGIIYKLIHHRHQMADRNQHRSITLTLLITTFLFLLMTVPATIGFSFFVTSDSPILNLLDGILYTYHITSFPLYMITYRKFRREVFALITCKRSDNRIAPQHW